MKGQSELIEKNETLLKSQSEALSKVEKSMSESSDALKKLSGRVDTLEEEVRRMLTTTGEMQASLLALIEVAQDTFFQQTSLRDKVNASDITALMPSGDSGEASSLMPKVLELQTKMNGLEGMACGIRKLLSKYFIEQMGAVPQDVQDQLAALRSTVDTQSQDLSSVSIANTINS